MMSDAAREDHEQQQKSYPCYQSRDHSKTKPLASASSAIADPLVAFDSDRPKAIQIANQLWSRRAKTRRKKADFRPEKVISVPRTNAGRVRATTFHLDNGARQLGYLGEATLKSDNPVRHPK